MRIRDVRASTEKHRECGYDSISKKYNVSTRSGNITYNGPRSLYDFSDD